jgi:ArsR family transcriptional regulator
MERDDHRDDRRVVTGLKALADPARLRILEFLRKPEGECCARDDGVCGCDFEDLLGLSQPTVSHHLKILVKAGLLRAEKRGRWTYYELEPAALSELASYLERLSSASRPVPAAA